MCVLLVEDELLILMAIGQGIKDAGHKAMTAMSGPEAIAHISHNPGVFSALVTDYNMPGSVNGIEVVKYMRDFYPFVPMFIATATPNSIPEDAQREYAIRLVSKPYRVSNLVSMITSVL